MPNNHCWLVSNPNCNQSAVSTQTIIFVKLQLDIAEKVYIAAKL